MKKDSFLNATKHPFRSWVSDRISSANKYNVSFSWHLHQLYIVTDFQIFFKLITETSRKLTNFSVTFLSANYYFNSKFVKEFMNITTTNSFLLIFMVCAFNFSIFPSYNYYFFQESDVSSRNNLFSCTFIISNLFDRTKSWGDYWT